MLDLNRAVALALLGFSSGYGYLAYFYHLLPFEKFLAVRPNTMPIGLAIAGIICSLVILIQPQVPKVKLKVMELSIDLMQNIFKTLKIITGVKALVFCSLP